jgi:hypothetical protein
MQGSVWSQESKKKKMNETKSSIVFKVNINGSLPPGIYKLIKTKYIMQI